MSIDPESIVIFETPGDWSTVYVNGERTFTGHCDDVRERVLYHLGVTTEYPNEVTASFLQTARGDEADLAAIEGAYARMKKIER